MKQLDRFLESQDKTKPYALDSTEGADDKEYFDLMSQYKKLRHTDVKKANKVRIQAESLKDVSDDAQEAAMYL
jgi:hypothetical protein